VNDFDDLDQLKRDVGPTLLTALREVASQIRPEEMPRLDSGEILMGYISPSLERPLPDEPRRAPRRGAFLIGAVAVAAAVVGVAILDRPSRDVSPGHVPATTVVPASVYAKRLKEYNDYQQGPKYLLDLRTGKQRPVPTQLVAAASLRFAYGRGFLPSPDGTRFVVSDVCGAVESGCSVDMAGRMAVGNIDGSDVRTIIPPDGRRGATPSWSPDGTKIVYAAIDDSSADYAELVVADVTTGASTQITHLGQVPRGSSLSPMFTFDGRSVLFMLPVGPYPYSDVWSVPASGGEATLVIKDAEFPTPLADGTVAFVRNVFDGLWVVSIGDPGSVRPLVLPEDGLGVTRVVASPDRTRLIYWLEGNGVLTPARGGVDMVDVRTGAVRPVPFSVWLDKDTLMVGMVQ